MGMFFAAHESVGEYDKEEADNDCEALRGHTVVGDRPADKKDIPVVGDNT